MTLLILWISRQDECRSSICESQYKPRLAGLYGAKLTECEIAVPYHVMQLLTEAMDSSLRYPFARKFYPMPCVIIF